MERRKELSEQLEGESKEINDMYIHLKWRNEGLYIAVNVPYRNSEGKKRHIEKCKRIRDNSEIPVMKAKYRKFRDNLLRTDPRTLKYRGTHSKKTLNGSLPTTNLICIGYQSSRSSGYLWAVRYKKQRGSTMGSSSWACLKYTLEVALENAFIYRQKDTGVKYPNEEEFNEILQYAQNYITAKTAELRLSTKAIKA